MEQVPQSPNHPDAIDIGLEEPELGGDPIEADDWDVEGLLPDVSGDDVAITTGA